MDEYKTLQKKRRIKQFFMAGPFLVVIIGGWRYPLLGYFIPLCMLLGMGIGFFKGRIWCDWFCPRGSFFDALVKPISPKREIPKFFKSLPLRIGMLSFLMLMMTIQIIKRWTNPYKIGMFFVMLLTVTTILGIILALFFHQRTWCCFCAVGSMANWLGRRKYPLKIDSELCTECELCYKVCPIQVMPFSVKGARLPDGQGSADFCGGKFKRNETEFVKDDDCLKCRLCIAACPKKALSDK